MKSEISFRPGPPDRTPDSRRSAKARTWLLVIACALGPPAAANGEAVVYSSVPAVDCVVNPHRVVDVASPVAGVIETLHVERSQPVAAGQVIAQLEASVERANVELARYRAAVQSEIGLGRVNMNFDERRKERIDSLLQTEGVSRENADQVEREAQLSRWKLKQARELLDIRRLELRRAEEQLRQKSIRAPFDGFVLDTFKHEGEHVEEQAILRLAQLDPLVVEAIVPMENFGAVRTGMLAEIRPEVLVEEKLVGQVTAVDLIGDTASNTFGVKLSMPNPDNRIPAGLKCIVKFIDQPTPAMIAAAAAAQTDARVSEGQVERASEDPATGHRAPVSKVATSALAAESGAVTAADQAPASSAEIPPPQPQSPDEPGATQRLARVIPPETAPAAPVTKKTPGSYMVLIEQAATDEATRALIGRLRQAGVRDLQEFDHGANKGTISLGVYRTRAAAIKRQQDLAGLGFSPVIVERYR